MKRRTFIQSLLAAAGLSFIAQRLVVSEVSSGTLNVTLPPHRKDDLLIATVVEEGARDWASMPEWRYVSSEEIEGQRIRKYFARTF